MKNYILTVFILLMLASCSKTPAPVAVPSPVATTLVSPAQTSVCTTGIVISATQSAVQFNWNASANTDTYNLVIKNLLTSTYTVQNTASTQYTAILSRNTPYSWFVSSKSSKTTDTAKSDVWKFYNSGPAVISYAPFPADLKTPTFGQVVSTTTGTVNLTWVGSSVSAGTIVNYDVYFGTTLTPALYKATVTDQFLNSVPVASGSTYYWKVITRDNAGNTSDSGVFLFSVK
jgi:hypothetical protein